MILAPPSHDPAAAKLRVLFANVFHHQFTAAAVYVGYKNLIIKIALNWI
jgi:hypothetical protein